jgi:cellulose synthase/poly-beta-1,6-N-acetylglucosamine synthase-like glycosyltransferase
LLHDAGGNRSHTVAALPKLIDELRARGYRFVTIPELLDVPRDKLMPWAGAGPARLASEAGFGLLHWFWIALDAVLALGIVLGLARLALISALAVRHKRREALRKPLSWAPPSLAVILPAFNEEAVICDAVRSLLASEMDGFDIIVIDDGSTDRTAPAVSETFAGAGRVKLWQRPNGGKAAAINYALANLPHEIVIIADADTIFEPGAVPTLVRHFRDPSVAAVAGSVKVSNRVNWISRFQALEYVTCQNLERRAQEMLDCIFVVPSCFGAWRRDALLAVGGISPATFAEDADATLKLERKGLRVIYEPGAIALTEVPQTIGQFLNQRIRWMYGCLQTAWLHRSALWRWDAKGIALFTLPNIVIYQVFFVLVSPVIDLVLIWSLIASARFYAIQPAGGAPANLYFALLSSSVFQIVEVGAAILAFRLESSQGKWWRLLPLAFIQRFCYRQLLYWVALVTLARIAKGRFYNWDKLRRYGAGARLARASVETG